VTVADTTSRAPSAPAGNQTAGWRISFGAMVAAISLLLACCVVRQIASLRSYGDINQTVGTWSASAFDAEHGVLYRPLISSDGYGGTRYAPLRTLIQAALMKWAELGPFGSAMLTSVLSNVLLLAGSFVLMRRLGVSRALAVALVCLILTGSCVRSGICGGMADPLAAAFSVWGLVAVTHLVESEARRSLWISVAATCFALAMATKLASLFGLTAGVLWLVSRRRTQVAARLAIQFLLTAVTLALVFQWASHGRMFHVIAACITGGATENTLTDAPTMFFGELYCFDQVVGMFWLLAIVIVNVRGLRSLPGLLLLITSLGTLAIYGSPGTDINHFIEMHVAAILCLAVVLQRRAQGATAIAGLVAVFTIAATFFCVREIGRIQDQSRKQHVVAVLSMVGDQKSGPLFSEDPMLPLVGEERPYILDCFMFDKLNRRQPEFGQQLWDAFAAQKFRAVVLCPLGGVPEQLQPGSFWTQSTNHLRGHYDLVSHEGRYFVFLPHHTN
jgi:hypothetical protein